jgi:rRNA processing protein Gar1
LLLNKLVIISYIKEKSEIASIFVCLYNSIHTIHLSIVCFYINTMQLKQVHIREKHVHVVKKQQFTPSPIDPILSLYLVHQSVLCSTNGKVGRVSVFFSPACSTYVLVQLIEVDLIATIVRVFYSNNICDWHRGSAIVIIASR